MSATLRLSHYFLIYVALLVLLGVTVGAAFIPLGPFNIVVTLVIAFTKAWLVAMHFMHLKESPRLTWLVSAGAFLWLVILIVGLMMDYSTRPDVKDAIGPKNGASSTAAE